MKEILTGAKSAFQLYIAVWAAIMVFDASAKIEVKWESALNELEVITYELGRSFIRDMVREALRPLIVARLSDVAQCVSKETNIRVDVDDATKVTFDLFSLKDSLSGRWTIRHLRDKLEPHSKVKAAWLWPKERDFVDALQKQLAALRSKPGAPLQIDEIQMYKPSFRKNEDNEPVFDYEDKGFVVIQFREPSSKITFWIHCYRETHEPDFELRDLFMQAPASKKLSVQIRDRIILFPNLKSVWPDVQEKTPREALYALEHKDAEEKFQFADFKLFGLSVRPTAAVVAGPLATLATLLFFRAHLLQALLNNCQSSEETRSLWIALYENWESLLITVVAIVLAPVAANCWLLSLYMALPSASTPMIGLAILLLFAIVLLSWDSLLKVFELNARVSSGNSQ